jgi:hypothetical protein
MAHMSARKFAEYEASIVVDSDYSDIDGEIVDVGD